jgi:hypothetical protein
MHVVFFFFFFATTFDKNSLGVYSLSLITRRGNVTTENMTTRIVIFFL